MAIKNRPTLKQQYDDYIDRVAPFDGNALIQKTEDKQVTNDDLDSTLMKNDAESTINSPNSAIDLDFISVDLYTINSSGSIDTVFVLTINNLGTGQVARIAITKKSGDTYSFASGTFNQIDNLDQTGTSLNFYVHNVDGTLIVESDLSISKSDSLAADNSNQLATSKAAFDLDVKKADKTQPDWIAITAPTTTGFTIVSDAFIKTNDQGISSFKGSILVAQTSGNPPAVAIGEIPSGERPDRDIRATVTVDKSGTGTSLIVISQGININNATGLIAIDSPGTSNSWTVFFDELAYFQIG